MALSTAVWVGEAKKWVPEMIEMAKKLKVSAGHEPGQIMPLSVNNSSCFEMNRNCCRSLETIAHLLHPASTLTVPNF